MFAQSGHCRFKPNGRKPRHTTIARASSRRSSVAKRNTARPDRCNLRLHRRDRRAALSSRPARAEGLSPAPAGRQGRLDLELVTCGASSTASPELLQYPDATVFICEGEKDADRVASLGHCATTVAGGKWTDDCVKLSPAATASSSRTTTRRAARRPTRPRSRCTASRRPSASCGLPGLPEKGTLATGSTPIRATPKSWLRCASPRRCGRRI